MFVLATDLHQRDQEEEDEVRRDETYGGDTAEVDSPHLLAQDHVIAIALALKVDPYGDPCHTPESRYQLQRKKG